MGASKETSIEIASIKTRFWKAGDHGPPLVLIHGIASSIEDWETNIPALARTHRVFALGLVGCGLSDKPANHDYSLRSLAEFVLAFMSAMGIEAAHLAGFSMGGRLALDCASRAPEHVLSLILLAPAAVGPDTIINFRLASVKGLGEILTRPSRFGMRTLLNAAFHDRDKVAVQMVADRSRFARLPGAQSAFLTMLRGMVRLGGFHPEVIADVQPRLPAIRQPSLVIWGLQDRFLPNRRAEILQRGLPNCRLMRYEACGHLSHIEHAEKFNAEAAAFLRSVDDGFFLLGASFGNASQTTIAGETRCTMNRIN
jgi:pimeloyl-ACP methyl ester carboxylesterase